MHNTEFACHYFAIAIFPVPTFIEPKDECFTNMGYIGSANYPNSNPAGDIIDSCYLRSNDSNYENITVTVTILNFNQFIRQGRHHLTVSAISRSDCQSSNATLYIEGPETHNYDPDYDINYMETITADIINVQYEQQQQQNVGNGGYYILGFEGMLNLYSLKFLQLTIFFVAEQTVFGKFMLIAVFFDKHI